MHMAKRLTTQEFVDRAYAIHGDRYDYSKVAYVNAHTNVVIVCRLHGEYIQEPTNHIHLARGCPICARGGTNEERFWSFINRDDGCWRWQGKKADNGYGRFWVDGGMVAAHRFSYELHHGKIPDGLFVLHRCDNPECTNPDHLFVGTLKDNMQDMVRKGRQRVQHGEKNTMSKLTESDVRSIRAKYKTGNYFQRELASEYGIALSTANQIINRNGWRHLDD